MTSDYVPSELKLTRCNEMLIHNYVTQRNIMTKFPVNAQWWIKPEEKKIEESFPRAPESGIHVQCGYGTMAVVAVNFSALIINNHNLLADVVCSTTFSIR